jgi:hypothetical protein
MREVRQDNASKLLFSLNKITIFFQEKCSNWCDAVVIDDGFDSLIG